MSKLKKALILVLTVILVFAITGCGEEGSQDVTKKTKLKIWIQSVNQPQYFMGWFEKAFENKYPDIDLDFQIGSQLDYTLDVSLVGANAPDMTATWGGLVLPMLARGGRVMDISEVMAEFEDDMINMSLLNKVDGKHYGAPIFGFASPVIYYNKTVFDSLGLEAPETYEEFVALCNSIRTVKNTNGKQKYQTLVTGYSYHFMTAIHGKTMSVDEINAIIQDYDPQATNPFSVDGFRKGFEWLDQMNKEGVFATNITGYTTSNAESEFALQNALMIGTPSLDLFALSNTCTFEIGAFTLPDAPSQYAPQNPSEAEFSGVYTDVMCINSKTKYPEECKKVLEFLYTTEAQEQLFNYYLFPVIKNVSYENISADIKTVFDNSFKKLYDSACQHGMNLYYMSYFYKTGLDSQLESAFKSVVNGAKTPQVVTDEICTIWRS